MSRLPAAVSGLASLALQTIDVDAYAAEVLPCSRPLWAGRRDAATYEAEWRDLAASGYGRRAIRTVGIRDAAGIAASCKTYARTLRDGERSLRALGIGAVFTPEERRGQGWATAMLGALLDARRAAGDDVAFLFSDIGAAFYARLGFAALPARSFALRAAALEAAPLEIRALGPDDEPAAHRCFDALDRARPVALRRTPLVRTWLARRARSREHEGDALRLGVRRGRALAAYVEGRRVPRVDTFVLDELAVASDADAALIPTLLRAAAADLRRVAGWLPPSPAREALPREAAIRRRDDAIPMVAPLSPAGRAALDRLLARDDDPFWSADHV